MTAKKELRYAGRQVLAGKEFEATEKDAKILIAINRASWAVDPVPEPQPEQKEEAPKKRAYKRRDMTAE
ncbi:hypothetical protein GFL01_10150 [Pseudomonas stutzeri]|nr:hypothetical protein [Stutzerimonas frequens]MBK3910674.1 hypothetical protein [Stutzerimonas frequens]MBK3929935.1 hypothetical protein [Stutzerimonas frequens]